MSNAKIVLIGDSGVGKTSLFQRFDSDTFQEDHIFTVGGAFAKVSIQTENGSIDCGVWDTAGQERFRNVVPMYFQKADYIIVVYDVTNKESFDSVDSWIEMAKDKAPADAKIVLVGNKIDLNEKRSVSFDEGTQFSSSKQISIFIETSAKTGHGTQLLLKEIGKSHIAKKGGDEHVLTPPVYIPPESEKKHQCLC